MAAEQLASISLRKSDASILDRSQRAQIAQLKNHGRDGKAAFGGGYDPSAIRQ
jgi:hypothetical protein